MSTDDSNAAFGLPVYGDDYHPIAKRLWWNMAEGQLCCGADCGGKTMRGPEAGY
jgi:hypothetical protein